MSLKGKETLSKNVFEMKERDKPRILIKIRKSVLKNDIMSCQFKYLKKLYDIT